MYYVYILSCQDDSLYTGITTDLKRRMRQHFQLSKGGAKYTRSHPPNQLCMLWSTETHTAAARFEACCKKLSHLKKLELIQSPDSWQQFLPQLNGLHFTSIVPEPIAYYLKT